MKIGKIIIIRSTGWFYNENPAHIDCNVQNIRGSEPRNIAFLGLRDFNFSEIFIYRECFSFDNIQLSTHHG